MVLYRHDDAVGPYIRVEDPWKEPHTAHTPWRFAMPPLPQKVYLSGERAEPIGRFWLTSIAAGLPANAVAEADAADRLTYRTYAILGHKFKAGVEGRVPSEVANVYRVTHMPKYVWVVEALDRALLDAGVDPVLGEALLDPTAHHESNPADPLFQTALALHVGGTAVTQSPDHHDTRIVTAMDFKPYRSFAKPNRR